VRARRRRTTIGLGLESDPVAGKGTGLTGGTHPSAREKGEGGKSGSRGESGPGRLLAGRAREREGEERRPARPCGRERKGRLAPGHKGK
jgi:hypothetical protein